MTGRWLVDGNNVMGSRPDGWWRDRTGAKARLAAEVDRWAEITGVDVILVFDGRPKGQVVEAATTIEVRFAGQDRPNGDPEQISRAPSVEADDVIVAGADSGDRVVTADRGLIDRLPPGVEIVGPKRFLDTLGLDVD